jgi:hypothetical protein
MTPFSNKLLDVNDFSTSSLHSISVCSLKNVLVADLIHSANAFTANSIFNKKLQSHFRVTWSKNCILNYDIFMNKLSASLETTTNSQKSLVILKEHYV